MRRGEWAESMPIIGIECVGLVVACPSGEFAPGMPVAARARAHHQWELCTVHACAGFECRRSRGRDGGVVMGAAGCHP